MVRMAEKRGTLVPGSRQHVLESSSGSLAKGLALVCARRGYKFTAVCDRLSASKNASAKAYGAEVFCVDGPPDADQITLRNLRRNYCKKKVEDDPYTVHLDQYHNEDSHMSYYHSLAPEIYNQCPNLDVLVVATGTGGQLRGCGLYFSETAPHVKVIATEGVGSTIFADPSTRKVREISDGTGYHCALPRVERALEEGTVKEIFVIEEQDSILTSAVVARTDGALVGPSGGMAIFAALCHMACASRSKGAEVRAVTICPDSLDPYKVQVADYIDRHFGEGLCTEDLVERLKQRVAEVAGKCTLGKGMIDPARLAYRNPSHRRTDW
jgi:cysteine synthase A